MPGFLPRNGQSPSDSARCTYILHTGVRCPNLRDDGGVYCPFHGKDEQNQRREQSKRIYRTAIWQSRIQDFADHDDLKSLREEIGVTRLIVEEHLNACRTPNDLLLRSHTIGELVEKLRKLVESCDRIDFRNGVMIDRSKLIVFGQSITDLLSDLIQDPDILMQFAKRLATEIEKITTDPLADLPTTLPPRQSLLPWEVK